MLSISLFTGGGHSCILFEEKKSIFSAIFLFNSFLLLYCSAVFHRILLLFLFFLLFEIRVSLIAQTHLKMATPGWHRLPQCSTCWDYRCKPHTGLLPLLNLYVFFPCMCVFFVDVHMCIACMPGVRGGQKRELDLRIWSYSYELSCEFWELNTSPLARAMWALNC